MTLRIRQGKSRGQIADEPWREFIVLAKRLLEQTQTSKLNIHSSHALEVECLAKAKAQNRYEFGCKTSVATTNRHNWIVGAEALDGNPPGGHTLRGTIAEVECLTG